MEEGQPTPFLIDPAASPRNQKNRFHSDLNASKENALGSQESTIGQNNPVLEVASIQEFSAIGQGGIHKHLSDMMLEE